MTQKTTAPEDEFAAAFAEAAAQRRGEEVQPSEPASEPKVDESAEGVQQEPAAAPAPELTLEQRLEALQRERDDAIHRERSASARVSAFHKKLNAVQAELESFKAKPAAPVAPAEEDEELEAAVSEMPEIAKLVDRLVDKRVAQSVKQVEEKVDQAVTPLRKRAEQDELASEIAVVDKEFPDWRQTVYTPAWDEWLATKSPAIQGAYAQAKTAADALEFLRMYRSEKGQKPADPQPQATRQDRLSKSVGIPSRQQPAVKSGAPAEDDFEGAFEYFAAQRRKSA